MFALAALICFVLALFGVQPGSLDLLILGWCFIATHLLLGGGTPTPPWPQWRRNRGQT